MEIPLNVLRFLFYFVAQWMRKGETAHKDSKWSGNSHWQLKQPNESSLKNILLYFFQYTNANFFVQKYLPSNVPNGPFWFHVN